MDTSKEYIKMCEKAVETRDFITGYSRGDFIVNPHSIDKTSHVITSWTEKCDYIWLPRQDQLQDMVKNSDSIIYDLLDRFNTFVKDAKTLYFNMRKNYSMEQLWLVFIMQEKYGKVWDGKEWTKI